MKGYFILTALVCVAMVGCNEQKKEEAPVKIVEMEVLKTTVDSTKTELMQVSALSAEELKDDSIFTDGSKPSSWEAAGITDVKGLKMFIKQLQQWIIVNDKDSLAASIQYPLNKTIKTKEDLVANYNSVFTKEVKLSFATVNFNQIFRNANGVMVERGKVWLGQQGNEFKITAINYAPKGY
jgi:uncharacterized lipoprotein NlpE involved in copper resistance